MTKLVACSVFLIGSFAFGQEARSSHTSPEDAFTTRELVAWSYLQTPQPAPQPLPGPEAQPPRPDQQRVSQSDAQLFIGKVVKDSKNYGLQVSNGIFLLDGNVDSRNEDQAVRVLGTQDTSSGAIHAIRIERLP